MVVGAANILVAQRLPTGTVLAEGIAPVDSPWKTLFDRLLPQSPPSIPSPSRTNIAPFNRGDEGYGHDAVSSRVNTGGRSEKGDVP